MSASMPELPPLITPAAQSRCVAWHSSHWEHMSTLFAKARLPHAMLLEGQPGTGRNRLALTLARYLLCSDRGALGNCGNCKTCTLSASGAHPDLLTVTPAEAGKAIGIDAIRQALRFATGTPTLGKQKVLLISPAESLTAAAHNAFLKCLEEPSPETFIVLVSASGHPLPATIRSRCQRWHLVSPNASLSRDWLLAALGADAPGHVSQMVEPMLELCAGRPLEALRKLQDGNGEALISVHAAATRVLLGEERGTQKFELAAANTEPELVLDVVEQTLRSWLRSLPVATLRSRQGHRGFAALQTIERLRSAKRSGTNPNADLLRFTVMSAIAGLWDK
ncbi:MAG: DNA polymerase III subunit delta' [Congregibacter sp.]|nr:DNA polymerase III subunit delta' [Congregibacter sp.]